MKDLASPSQNPKTRTNNHKMQLPLL